MPALTSDMRLCRIRPFRAAKYSQSGGGFNHGVACFKAIEPIGCQLLKIVGTSPSGISPSGIYAAQCFFDIAAADFF